MKTKPGWPMALKKSALFLFFVTLALFTAPPASANMTINTLEEPPANFTNERGELTGISVEMVREIQRRIGNNDPIKVYPWARTYKNVLTLPNVVAFTASRTAERENKFHWIAMISRNAYKFYTRKDSGVTITSLDDAKKLKRIGVLRGSVWESLLKTSGFTNLDPATDHIQNVKKLAGGRFDVIYFTEAGLFRTCKKAGVNFDSLKPVFQFKQVESYIIMSKNGTPESTVKLWKDTVRQIKEDGTYRRIAAKWIAYLKDHDGFDCHYADGAINYWKK